MRAGALFLLTLVCVVLGALLGANWFDRDFALRVQRWTPPKPVMLDPDSLNVPMLGATQSAPASTAAQERPLFFRSRKPPVPPPPPPVPPPPPPPPKPDPLAKLELFGLFSLGPDKGGVIAKLDGKMRQIRVGERVGEWQLKSVSKREALFVSAEAGERTIPMSYRAQIEPPAAPATPVPRAVEQAGGQNDVVQPQGGVPLQPAAPRTRPRAGP
jgi:hypothetical protein